MAAGRDWQPPRAGWVPACIDTLCRGWFSPNQANILAEWQSAKLGAKMRPEGLRRVKADASNQGLRPGSVARRLASETVAGAPRGGRGSGL